MMQPPRIMGGIFALILSAATFAIVVAICALFQGGIMSYMGFEYEDAPSFFLFFVLGYLICSPLDALLDAIPEALVKAGILKSGSWGYYGLRTAADTVFTALCLGLVDIFMDSVSAPWYAILVSSAALAGLGFWIDFRTTAAMERMKSMRP